MQIQTWFGIFTAENNTITDAEIFPKDPEYIAERLLNEKLLQTGNIAGRELWDLAIEYGFVNSRSDYNSLLHKVNILLAGKKVEHALTPDKRIIASVEALDDINETMNILSERLKEWYILNFDETPLKGEELARKIQSADVPHSSFDITLMQSFSSGLLGLYKIRNDIDGYIRDNMAIIAPNLTDIAGHVLGARLLSIAGGLDKLAVMPSGTIQVIGANNALFKHLKGKASSPKHGIIFRHPLINTAPFRQRGKIARALASKISLAARYDLYRGEKCEDLSESLKLKIDAIRKR